MKINIKLVNISTFYSFFVIGITISIASPILIEISENLNSPLIITSLIFTVFFFGYGLGPHVGNLLNRVLSRKIIIGASFFIQSAFLLLFPFFRTFYLAFLIFFFIGACGGFLDMVLSVILADIHPQKESFFLNISHVFLSVGAFISPYIVSLSMKIGQNWQIAFYISAIISFINFLFFISIKFPDDKKDNYRNDSLPRKNTKSFFIIENYKYLILFLVFATFFYAISESGINSWLPTFLRLIKRFSQLEASQVLSFFWLAIAIGRIVIGIVSLRVNIIKVTVFISFLGFICAIIGTFSKILLINYIFFFLTGFFYSGIFPNLLAISSIYYKKSKSIILSFMITAVAVGSLVAPQLVSLFFKFSSLYIAFVLLGVVVFFALLLIILFSYKSKKYRL